MKKVMLLALALFLLSSVPARATYVSFDFTYHFDDSGGSNYFLQCIDAHTGVILLSESPIASGSKYTMRIPKDDHDKILCIVKVFGGPVVGLWRIYPKRYYQGCGGSVISDLPDDTGTCGDGVVSGVEKCDTGGDAGCSPSSATPRCCDCDYCGCADNLDCPQVTGAQCGYGKCSPTERPVFTPTCYDCGTCIYPYHCVADPACSGTENPVETEEAGFCIDEDAVHGALVSGQSGTFFLGAEPLEVSYLEPLLFVGADSFPGPFVAGSVFFLSDGTWVGIDEAGPGMVHFYLRDHQVLEAETEEWRNRDIAVDKDGRENRRYLKKFLKKVLRKVADRQPEELIELVIKGDRKYKASSAGTRVTGIREGNQCDTTLRVRLDLETLEGIFEETLTVGDAISQGLITVLRM